LRAFRRFRHRQLLRIGTNDMIRDRPLDEITHDISRVADVAIEVALETAQRLVARRFGEPVDGRGRPLDLRRSSRSVNLAAKNSTTAATST
jgi:glutamate-ammonia-ligase adenylyltransferase